MVIKKTKVFNFINKVYHINQEMNRVTRKKNKKKAETVGKTLLTGVLMREKSINQIMEKVHKKKKYQKIFSKRRDNP